MSCNSNLKEGNVLLLVVSSVLLLFATCFFHKAAA